MQKLLGDPSMMEQYIEIDQILDRIRKIKRNLAKAVRKLDEINPTP